LFIRCAFYCRDFQGIEQMSYCTPEQPSVLVEMGLRIDVKLLRRQMAKVISLLDEHPDLEGVLSLLEHVLDECEDQTK
jgi:predicted TIM-barrel fold metal-dependent hydrolase